MWVEEQKQPIPVLTELRIYHELSTLIPRNAPGDQWTPRIKKVNSQPVKLPTTIFTWPKPRSTAHTLKRQSAQNLPWTRLGGTSCWTALLLAGFFQQLGTSSNQQPPCQHSPLLLTQRDSERWVAFQLHVSCRSSIPSPEERALRPSGLTQRKWVQTCSLICLIFPSIFQLRQPNFWLLSSKSHKKPNFKNKLMFFTFYWTALFKSNWPSH